jgi:cytosine/adenosine deaminase-related metal-dependent hydrolase
MAEVEEGVRENIEFARSIDAERKSGRKPLVEAMIGGHAPFTIPDEGLALMKAACDETNRGMHLHVAEDKYDVVWSHHMHGMDIVDRLDKYGLLSDKTLLVHGLWLNHHEAEVITNGMFLRPQRSEQHEQPCRLLPGDRSVDNLIIGTMAAAGTCSRN